MALTLLAPTCAALDDLKAMGLEPLRVQIRKGDVDAIYELGIRYERGIDVERDLTQAARLYKTAAERGSRAALFELAERFAGRKRGYAVPRDMGLAVDYYTRLAEKNDVPAIYRLAELSLAKYTKEKKNNNGEALDDLERSLDLLGRAIRCGRQSLHMYQEIVMSGVSSREKQVLRQRIEEDYRYYVRSLSDAAELCWQLKDDGQMALAIDCFHELAELPLPDFFPYLSADSRQQVLGSMLKAQVRLVDCYRRGIGVKPSAARLMKYARLALEQSYPPLRSVGGAYANVMDGSVEYAIGRCYEKGDGVEKSIDQARAWYKRAAQRGHGAARRAWKRLK